MTQSRYKDFAELYRAAYAEHDEATKRMLLHEVQRRIELCGEEQSPEPLFESGARCANHARLVETLKAA